ncbi:DUF6001 family protein [Pseudomonas tremae]|uniref:DUF6001 family protein n=1 Tax=Pseudomonas syringae group TaxID=136849 RepID=UPI000EFE8515|nr:MULTISPECIES: DUF6001 family protein [Pseudomonas syringae group]MCF5714940.1 hypothetical protein [Pseudomonas tremae]MCF5745602.1 hypothetical protein [Pseudomonas tremae]MCQ2990130.1 DUF6001 family protein [Pseudomonas tremae]RMN23309.1 hypothetical protein ALQ62_02147 [Pseudomonas coronafaciens pv. zizaniae]RMP33176.1 hypothetical protein ALQ25_01467 [Pseudomonas coronafaciens pv. atropurpurea]
MDYRAFYLNNTRQFLTARELSFDELDGVVERQYAQAHSTLITSSPVHGIANSASDIDLICVTYDRQSDQSMASQIYHNEHHMEVVAFAREEVEESLLQLARVAEQGTAQKLSAFKQWDKQHPVSRKYLERLVCAVSTEPCLPYLDSQKSLSAVWSVSAFDDYRQSACFSALAWRSGEHRAAAAYACNAALFLMNAILARHGWINSNRKWTLLRWDMAIRTHGIVIPDRLTKAVEQLWQRAYPACHSGLQGPDLMHMCELALLAEQAFACEADYAVLSPQIERPTTSAFLPGVELVINVAQQATLLPNITMPEALGTRPIDLAEQPQELAACLLRAARAGLISFSLKDHKPMQGAQA